MTEIEKKVVELVFVKQHIAELYKQKTELEKELEAFVGRTRETCSRTGKTIDEIGGSNNE